MHQQREGYLSLLGYGCEYLGDQALFLPVAAVLQRLLHHVARKLVLAVHQQLRAHLADQRVAISWAAVLDDVL